MIKRITTAGWVEKIVAHERFVYTRFGSGEIQCARGQKGRNGSGHLYTPKLREDIQKTLKLPEYPDFYYGTNEYCLGLSGGALRIMRGSKLWIDLEPMYEDIINGTFAPFIEALRTRKIILVGPPHFIQFNDLIAPVDTFIEVPIRQCYDAIDDVLIRCLDRCEEIESPLIVASFSLGSVCLAREIYFRAPNASFFDAGSIWEPFFKTGIAENPRGWYKKIKVDVMSNIPTARI